MVNKFRSQREVRRPDSEIEIRKVYLQLDRYLSDNYGKGEDLTEIQLMQTLIIAHNFLTSDGQTGDSVHQLHLWKLATPILELLGNIDSLLVEENPLTLRYFFYAVHDLQLIHFLILLDYIELGEGTKWSKGSIKPPTFNASLRFEVLQNPLYVLIKV